VCTCLLSKADDTVDACLHERFRRALDKNRATPLADSVGRESAKLVDDFRQTTFVYRFLSVTEF